MDHASAWPGDCSVSAPEGFNSTEMRKMEPPKAQSSAAAPNWAVIAVVLTCSLCIFCAVAQAQQGYNLTLVAKNGDVIAGKTILSVGAPPVINNRGDIAFEASFGPGLPAGAV